MIMSDSSRIAETFNWASGEISRGHFCSHIVQDSLLSDLGCLNDNECRGGMVWEVPTKVALVKKQWYHPFP